MGTYVKPWRSFGEQVDLLAGRGVDVEPRPRTLALLRTVGHYRLSGYLYPFRGTQVDPATGRSRVLSTYEPGTSIAGVAEIVDFDRRLRLLVLDGVEWIEVALRVQVGSVLGNRSAFAHLDPATFLPVFGDHQLDPATGWRTRPSRHAEWLARVAGRRASSDEASVAHFRDRYDDQMPIWALTEILELGHLSRLYQGLTDDLAAEIADAFRTPTKRLMASWLASVNYVRNVAAHHARLFNRKLQHAPGRPRPGAVPLLDHLRADDHPKGAFGVYNALAVIAYLLRAVDAHDEWVDRAVALLRSFPATPPLPVSVIGVPDSWSEQALWLPTPASSEADVPSPA